MELSRGLGERSLKKQESNSKLKIQKLKLRKKKPKRAGEQKQAENAKNVIKIEKVRFVGDYVT